MSKAKIVYQDQVTECGLACISMISHAFQKPVSLRHLRNKYQVSLEHGFSIFQIVSAAADFGLLGKAVAFDLEELKELKCPCILHWGGNHFVVLEKVAKSKMTILDPALGKRRLLLEEAGPYLTGYAIEFAADTSKIIKNNEISFLNLIDFASAIVKTNSTFLFILVCGLFLQIFALASPSYLKLVIDEAIQNSAQELLFSFTLIFIFVFLFENIYRFLVEALKNFLSIAFNAQLSFNSFGYMLALPMFYFMNRTAADIRARVESADYISVFMVHQMIGALIAGIGAILSLALMFYFDWVLAIISLTGLSIFALVRGLLAAPLRRYSKEELVMKAHADGHVLNAINGIGSIKVFGMSSTLTQLWNRSFNQSLKARKQKDKYRILFDTLSRSVLHAEQLAVVTYSGYQIINGNSSIGSVYAYIQYKQIFGESFVTIMEAYLERNVARVHVDRLSDILLTKSETVHDEVAKQQVGSGSEIETLKELSSDGLEISYPGRETPVLRNVSFQLQLGDTLVVMGKTGSGKSSFLSILLGFHEPSSGSLLVDGQALEKGQNNRLRKIMATVTPRDQFFAGTLGQNISSFSGAIDRDRLIRAAKMARIHNRIEDFDHGYKTDFDIAKFILSTGEFQRLLIARALYREPKILILDEFTANLDDETAHAIWNDIKTLNCIRIVATHERFIVEHATDARIIKDGLLEPMGSLA